MQIQNPTRRGHHALVSARSFLQASLLALLVMASSAIGAQSLPPVMEDVREPAQLEGDLERSSGGIVLLHFWTSWCIPCREEMTALAEFRRHEYPDLAERGLRVLTVSNDVRDQDLERFAEEFDLAFPLYYDPYSKLTSRYGVRDELTAAGVPFERIRPIWFGWEPPQIDSLVAEEYGVASLMDDYGRDGINQSVVMVIF